MPFWTALGDLVTWQKLRLTGKDWLWLFILGCVAVPIVSGIVFGVTVLGSNRTVTINGELTSTLPMIIIISAVFGLIHGFLPALVAMLVWWGLSRLLGYTNIQLGLVLAGVWLLAGANNVLHGMNWVGIALTLLVLASIALGWIWRRVRGLGVQPQTVA